MLDRQGGGTGAQPLCSAIRAFRNKVCSLRLPAIVLDALKRRRASQEDEHRLAGTSWKGDGGYVFTSSVGTPLEQKRVDRIFNDVTAAAGLRQIRFHDLRHSAASILIAQGVHPKAIQELLRHSSIQLTMDTYGHLFDQVRRETADKMGAVFAAADSEKNVPIAVKTAVKPRLTRVK